MLPSPWLLIHCSTGELMENNVFPLQKVQGLQIALLHINSARESNSDALSKQSNFRDSPFLENKIQLFDFNNNIIDD